jgi:hypothetical protein
MNHEDSEQSDPHRRYRVVDRSGLVASVSLKLAEQFSYDDEQSTPEVLRSAFISHFRRGIQSLDERGDDELLQLAEEQGTIEDLVASAVLDEIDVPPLLAWYETRLRSFSTELP